ncbi:serine hydrolase domain-containing protein [Altererythrobacter lutimaris]|uniref:Beta-lactamase family protein n=1 Tax=Altererythrobacter lutimaris TaxID=2743979 RepID=A0A850HDQ9_9SPHN|nr:serine hydrolase domain-containing protein [Altererythrobacter lutimaris]NVE95166.1 beta-lactamase family protein [Altererythrobacter lutimaris]
MKTHVSFAGLASIAALVIAQPAMAQSYSYAELGSDGRIATEVEGDGETGALYEAGSIGKFACTIAALRLSDRGALDIDAPLSALLEEAKSTPVADVTFRQVLQSRSGIADGLMPAFRADAGEVLRTNSASEALVKYATGELANTPGEVWSYDLINWAVVQAVLEQATGRPIAEILREIVLEPAGMGQSRIFVGEIGEGAAPPAERGIPIPSFLTCAGGLATTPTDLLALARFPHKGGLSQNALSDLTSIATPEEGYTLGGRFRVSEEGKLLSWQSGSNGAYKSLVVYEPESDSGFAAMSADGTNEGIQSARAQWLAKRD